MRRAEDAVEILDRAVPLADRAASLADIDRLDTWFGGDRLARAALARAVAQVPRPLVIDVGGGTGAFAVRLARRARRRGRALGIVVVERDADTLALAARRCAGFPEIRLVRADAAALPFREDAADAAICSLLLHHLVPDAAVAALADMRVAARTTIVNDLLRSRLSLALVWLATRVVARHPISRHDGPLSVRRAYAPAELRVLAEKAGFTRVTIRRHPLLARLVALLS